MTKKDYLLHVAYVTQNANIEVVVRNNDLGDKLVDTMVDGNCKAYLFEHWNKSHTECMYYTFFAYSFDNNVTFKRARNGIVEECEKDEFEIRRKWSMADAIEQLLAEGGDE